MVLCTYKVKQKDEVKRNPMIDLEHSVDRTYMTNRHQSQFLGRDLLSRFRFKIKKWDTSDNDDVDTNDEYDQYTTERDLLAIQRNTVLTSKSYKIVDEDKQMFHRKDPILGYRENLIQQTEQESGASLCRILSAKNLSIMGPCMLHNENCRNGGIIDDSVQIYNHLLFDFDTHQLTVENISEESTTTNNRTRYYRVNVEKLAKETGGFNHASCQSFYPDMIVDHFSFLDYTYLSHVDLTVAQSTGNIDHVNVEATYGGIAAL